MIKTLKNIKQVQPFLHDIQSRTSSDVKNKFAEACSNFQVPTTGLENHFQLKELNSYINQNMTCKENSKQFENDRQKRNPHSIEGALRLLLQEDYYMLTRVHVSKYQKSWSKGENANPQNYTTWSNKSKGENADLYADIINLLHNVSEEIAEKIRCCQNSSTLQYNPERCFKYARIFHLTIKTNFSRSHVLFRFAIKIKLIQKLISGLNLE